FDSRAEIVAAWEKGWACAFAALDALVPADLTRTIYIRGHAHSVIEAIHRQMDHYGYHVGQIVLIARMLAGPAWKTLSVQPGGSEEFNRRTWGPGPKSGTGGA